MGSLREQQRQLRETFIIGKAHELLVEQGYDAMNMDELAARVGISKATLYQHFASKEEVAVRVVVDLINHATEALQADADTSRESAFKRLEGCLRIGLERRAQLWSAHLSLPAAVIKKHPIYVQAQERIFTLLHKLVEQAKADGDMNPNLCTPVIVQMALSLFKADYEDLLTLGKCTSKELVDTLTSVMLNGLKPF